MASISRERQLKDGTWTFTIRLYDGEDMNGKSKFVNQTYHSQSKSYKTARKDAEKATRDFERDYEEGKIGTGRQPFAEYAAYTVNLLYERGKIRISTQERYTELLERVNEKIGTTKVKDITPVVLNRLFSWLGEDGQNKKTGGKLSDKTIREYYAVVRRVLALAMKEGLIASNPAERVEKPSFKKKEVEFVPPEMIPEIETALENEELQWRVFLEIEIWTGARPGEIVGLKWTDFEFSEGREAVRIERNIQYSPKRGVYVNPPKTNNGNRTIPIPQTLAELLKEYRREQGRLMIERGDYFTNEGWLFLNGKGNGEVMHPDSPCQWFKRFCKRNGFTDITLYSFRHGFASTCVAGNVDIREVSRLMGHATAGFTLSTYVHAQERRDSVTVLQRMYAGKRQGGESGEKTG